MDRGGEGVACSGVALHGMVRDGVTRQRCGVSHVRINRRLLSDRLRFGDSKGTDRHRLRLCGRGTFAQLRFPQLDRDAHVPSTPFSLGPLSSLGHRGRGRDRVSRSRRSGSTDHDALSTKAESGSKLVNRRCMSATTAPGPQRTL